MTTRIEDIMTPRHQFVAVEEGKLSDAPRLAKKNGFDAIPILRDGRIVEYWSEAARRRVPITRRQKIPHELPVPEALPRLLKVGIQFVYYRTEMVGLVHLSDLNKPLGRLPWLQAILECEEGILTKTAALPEDKVILALGGAANAARGRKKKAQREDMHLPLLVFAQFGDVLKAAVKLGILHVSTEEVNSLSEVRNRMAHGVRTPIERPSDGKLLQTSLMICLRIKNELGI